DQVDVDGIDAGAHQGLARRGDAEIRGDLVIGRNMPLLDAGALANPAVAGIDHAREVVIAQDFFRQVGADAANHGSNEGPVSPRPRLMPAATDRRGYYLRTTKPQPNFMKSYGSPRPRAGCRGRHPDRQPNVRVRCFPPSDSRH